MSKNVWECACGQGHLSEVLKENGYTVKSTDLIDRGYGEVQDFLTCHEPFNGDILTNPPFKSASDFVRKGFMLVPNGNKICLFLRIQFLEGKERKQLFKDYPLKHLLVYSERQLCAKDAAFKMYKATLQCYAWFIFEKGYTGQPTIDWI